MGGEEVGGVVGKSVSNLSVEAGGMTLVTDSRPAGWGVLTRVTPSAPGMVDATCNAPSESKMCQSCCYRETLHLT